MSGPNLAPAAATTAAPSTDEKKSPTQPPPRPPQQPPHSVSAPLHYDAFVEAAGWRDIPWRRVSLLERPGDAVVVRRGPPIVGHPSSSIVTRREPASEPGSFSLVPPAVASQRAASPVGLLRWLARWSPHVGLLRWSRAPAGPHVWTRGSTTPHATRPISRIASWRGTARSGCSRTGTRRLRWAKSRPSRPTLCGCAAAGCRTRRCACRTARDWCPARASLTMRLRAAVETQRAKAQRATTQRAKAKRATRSIRKAPGRRSATCVC